MSARRGRGRAARRFGSCASGHETGGGSSTVRSRGSAAPSASRSGGRSAEASRPALTSPTRAAGPHAQHASAPRAGHGQGRFEASAIISSAQGGGRRSGGRTRRRRKPQPRKMIRVVSASGFRHRRHRKVASSRACAAAAARARRGRGGAAACLCAPPLVGPPLLEGVARPASCYLRPRSIGAVGHSGSLQSGSEAELKGIVICFAARWAGRARREGAPAVIRRPHQHWHGWRRGVESRSIIWGKKCCITSPPEEGEGGREAAGGRGPHRLGRRRARSSATRSQRQPPAAGVWADVAHDRSTDRECGALGLV